jgi:hypothetical protein
MAPKRRWLRVEIALNGAFFGSLNPGWYADH